MQLAADQVYVLAHWVTDRDLKRRFDVPFLVARMPEGQTPVADDKEQFEPLWIRPQDALQRHRENDFFIIFPTIRTLERMQAFGSVDAVLAETKKCLADLIILGSHHHSPIYDLLVGSFTSDFLNTLIARCWWSQATRMHRSSGDRSWV